MDRSKIILLSGKGKRFLDAGYKIPKGLIKYQNIELAIHSAKSLPKVDNTIFVLQDKDASKSFEKSIKKNYSKNFNFYYLTDYTNGQATSCYEVVNNSKNIDSFYVSSCDFSFRLNEKALDSLIIEGYESIVFTYKAKKYNFDNPKSFGWIREENNIVKIVSCKERIEPKKDSDFIIIGAFYFKEKNIFNYYYRKMLEEKRLINNETYVDIIIQMMVDDNLKIYNYPVSSFLDFGTPEQFEIQKKL